MRVKIILLFLAFTVINLSNAIDSRLITSKISWLNAGLLPTYWSQDRSYVFPSLWEHQKGLFESAIHFNVVDKINSDFTALVRSELFKIDDINMFVTSFVVYGMLQAKQLGTIVVDDNLIKDSLSAISQFRDKNSPLGVPQYSFWPQTKINGVWSAQAKNIGYARNLIPTLPAVLQPFADVISQKLLGITSKNVPDPSFYSIPADNDDSSVNLALEGLLRETNSNQYAFWSGLHTKKQEYYERALKYAYRPFGPIPDDNKFADVIDPRTYFVLRELLDKKKQQNRTLILPTTWLIKFDEQVEGLLNMPFRSNNVDASVSANFIFGLCYQLISGEVQLSPLMRQMLFDTIELLEFTVTRALNQRPTLMLVYYPSKYDFYWFIARTVGLLKRTSFLPDPLGEVKTRLEKLMKTTATEDILNSAVRADVGANWQQFLGNFAGRERKEDAAFSTSLALNALLDTWTVRNGASVTFDQDLPAQVKTAIENGVLYLLSLNATFSKLNAFFSGSEKVYNNTYPYFFPANYAFDKQGRTIDPTQLGSEDINYFNNAFMKGYVDPSIYQGLLQKKWFGSDVPVEEVSLNSGEGLIFPFWSSTAITHIMAITSLSKYLRATSGTAAVAPAAPNNILSIFGSLLGFRV